MADGHKHPEARAAGVRALMRVLDAIPDPTMGQITDAILGAAAPLIAERIARALLDELETSSRVPPPEDMPWEHGSLAIHDTQRVRADAAAIARRVGGY